jgi:hypothetical protein
MIQKEPRHLPMTNCMTASEKQNHLPMVEELEP